MYFLTPIEMFKALWFMRVQALVLALFCGVAFGDGGVVAPVRFATTTIKPWGIDYQGAPDKGLLVDVMRALEEDTGLPVDNVMLPYPRVIHELFAGNVDMGMIFDSPTSLSQAVRVGHITDSRIVVVGHQGAAPIASLNELSGMRVGHIRGSKYGPSFDENTVFTKVPINTMVQGLMMLHRGRLDAMTATDQAFYWAIKEMGADIQLFPQLMVIREATIALYMSKTSRREELLPIYRASLETLKKNGTLEDIFNRAYEWSRPKKKNVDSGDVFFMAPSADH